MLTRSFLLILFSVLAAAPASAQLAEDSYPEVVHGLLRAARDACDQARTGPLNIGARAITAADVNGDGAYDYLVDFAAVGCTRGSRPACGREGCDLAVVLSGPRGYRLSWRAAVDGHHLSRTSAARGYDLRLRLKGTVCGGAVPAVCGRSLVWVNDDLIETAFPLVGR